MLSEQLHGLERPLLSLPIYGDQQRFGCTDQTFVLLPSTFHSVVTSERKRKILVQSYDDDHRSRKTTIDPILNCVSMHSTMAHSTRSTCSLSIIHENDASPVNWFFGGRSRFLPSNPPDSVSCRPPRYRRLAMDDAPFVCRRAALTRVYRHTTGAQPIEPEHMQVDSDDEIYPEWTQQLSRRMMEDFQDVNEGEKEMMIMWNHHVMKHKCGSERWTMSDDRRSPSLCFSFSFIADSQMPLACELFVERHAKDLREKKLVKNFYLHLATLQLYNLIKKTDLAKCIIRLKTLLASSPAISTATWSDFRYLDINIYKYVSIDLVFDIPQCTCFCFVKKRFEKYWHSGTHLRR